MHELPEEAEVGFQPQALAGGPVERVDLGCDQIPKAVGKAGFLGGEDARLEVCQGGIAAKRKGLGALDVNVSGEGDLGAVGAGRRSAITVSNIVRIGRLEEKADLILGYDADLVECVDMAAVRRVVDV